ncbi:MAG: hypothetical protein PVH88_03515 [Ignavibacteria bacterium]|jgi:hypothetical protein
MQATVKIDCELAIQKIEKKDNVFSIKKRVENLELKYLPYYLFKAEMTFKKDQSITQHICVDTINGEYAFVEREKLNLTENEIEINKSNLDENEASLIAKNAVKSMLMVQKGKGTDLEKIELQLETVFNYPYWIGYYKRKSGIDFEVVDAVNGKKQGVKMKPVFIKLIMQ